MVSALNLTMGNHGGPTLLGFSGEWPQVFFKPTDAIRLGYIVGLSRYFLMAAKNYEINARSNQTLEGHWYIIMEGDRTPCWLVTPLMRRLD